jgi:hypothetical protein
MYIRDDIPGRTTIDPETDFAESFLAQAGIAIFNFCPELEPHGMIESVLLYLRTPINWFTE